jgi:hypothetical protein
MPNITGTDNGENLNDTAADDVIDALGGDDTITVVNGRDEVHGGTGNDTLIINYADAVLVKICCRLIKQEDCRLMHYRECYLKPLLHPG